MYIPVVFYEKVIFELESAVPNTDLDFPAHRDDVGSATWFLHSWLMKPFISMKPWISTELWPLGELMGHLELFVIWFVLRQNIPEESITLSSIGEFLLRETKKQY